VPWRPRSREKGGILTLAVKILGRQAVGDAATGRRWKTKRGSGKWRGRADESSNAISEARKRIEMNDNGRFEVQSLHIDLLWYTEYQGSGFTNDDHSV
jgi:hypothetical protein